MSTETKEIKKTGDSSKLFRKTGKLAIKIRPMEQKDLMEVCRIEKDVYEGANHWRYDDFFRAMRERELKCWVATTKWDDNDILGYVIYRAKRIPGNQVLYAAEIQNITVIEKMQRNGIGLNLVANVAHAWRFITANVSEYSTKTQKFFKSCGFECVQVLKGEYSFKTKDGETRVFDAYRFELEV